MYNIIIIGRSAKEMLCLPGSSIRCASALASSSAVTHFCLSTSDVAFRWKVWLPPLEMTIVHESAVVMNAEAKLIVPRHVCVISAWFLVATKKANVDIDGMIDW